MKHLLLAFAFCFASLSSGLLAEDYTNHPKGKEAKELVMAAIKFYKEKGKDAAIAEINKTEKEKGLFSKGEFYIFLFDMQGNCIARGDGNAKLIGKNMMAQTDVSGKEYIAEMITIANKKTSGWVDYQRNNPETKKIEEKSSYVEKHDNLMFGCGFYKK